MVPWDVRLSPKSDTCYRRRHVSAQYMLALGSNAYSSLAERIAAGPTCCCCEQVLTLCSISNARTLVQKPRASAGSSSSSTLLHVRSPAHEYVSNIQLRP
jgi:hypothetical protein